MLLLLRPAVPLVVALFAGCAFFNPPCTRLAKIVCDLPTEGDACAFVLGIGRNDATGQALCSDLLPAASEHARDRSDVAAKAEWQHARAELEREGFRPNPRAGRIDERLKAVGGAGGRVVEGLENAFDEGEQLLEQRMKAIE